MNDSIDVNVVDVTEATFEDAVIKESSRRPVVVDLWAEWCGPCKTLGPILERVAGERAGAFLLAKLDVDANPMISQAFGVQSIPTVVAFRDGEIVNGFVGAYPEEAVNRFVDELLPTEAEVVAEEAHVEEKAGDLEGAESGYRTALEKDPDNREAAVGLGRLLVERGDLEEARALLGPLTPDPDAERVLGTARVLEWGSVHADGPLGAAQVQAAAGRWREALEAMVACLADDRDAARAVMVDAFTFLGEDDPLVTEYRRRLASALY